MGSALLCGCDTIAQTGYFKVNEQGSAIVPIVKEEYEAVGRSDALLVRVCPRCGHLTGDAGQRLTKLFTAPGSMIPVYFHMKKRLMFAASGAGQERLSNS
ncbi:hypothetical protein [Paenibacillus pasadenensis]|uniref:hypothetical protein n=1 Tax=Paenibacillus pasadenensis TaxID=217090 RepID=UPI000FDB26E1|nr:hypothetical protein [Paenibacillus pasadenensis]